MVVVEMFAGTRSIGKEFEKRGHKVYSIEWNKDFENIDLYADIGTLTKEDILNLTGGVTPDVIWASPDCTTYSLAAIRYHRRKNPITDEPEPISDYAKFCDKVNSHVIELIKELNPKFYFIENPRACLKKMLFMKDLPCYYITYCTYGARYMKPTNIWTNHPNPQFKVPCKNGCPNHERAPRGSKSGVQGLKNSKERAVIPEELCRHIVKICEEGMND